MVLLGKRPTRDEGRLGVLLWLRGGYIRVLPLIALIVALSIVSHQALLALIAVPPVAYFFELNRNIRTERRIRDRQDPLP
jgi:hypothetical protein